MTPERQALLDRLHDWAAHTLEHNEHKGSWRGTPLHQLRAEFIAEVMEFLEAVDRGDDPWPELGDVAASGGIYADESERQRAARGGERDGD